MRSPAKLLRASRSPGEVTPFLVGKYELTQAQWAMIQYRYDLSHGAVDPTSTEGIAEILELQQDEDSSSAEMLSRMLPSTRRGELGERWLQHPVESVSRADCLQALHRVGLDLPTETQ